MEENPPSPVDSPEVLGTPTVEEPIVPQNRFVNKRNIATLIGIAVFLIVLVSAIVLIKGQQDVQNKASGGGECVRSADCKFLDNPGNQGSYEAPRPISYIFVTAKDFFRYDKGESDDGCYSIKIRDRFLEWYRIGSGPNCRDVSNIQVWMEGRNELNSGSIGSATCEGWTFYFNHPLDEKAEVAVEVGGVVLDTATEDATNASSTTITGAWKTKLKVGDKVVFKVNYLGQNTREAIVTSCAGKTPSSSATPSPTPLASNGALGASCSSVKAYDKDWKLLSLDDLGKLKAGDSIRFAVLGTTTAGIFDKARFSVNGNSLGETDLKKDGSSEFYIEYALPSDTKSIKVDAQLHHNQLGWF